MLWVAGALGLFAQTTPACATPEPLTPEEVCDDARRGIALRTQSCTQDVELANRRYDLAKAKLTCNATLQIEKGSFDCSAIILASTCEDVAKFGDNMDAWTTSPPCKSIFTPFISKDPNNPTINQACTDDGASCTCRILEGAKNEGVCNAPPTGEGQLPTCCMSEGYPTRGSCTCGALSCIFTGSEGDRACQCAPKPLGFGSPSLGCSRLTFPELQGGTCCLSLGNQACHCSKATTCGSEETQVGSCEASTFCTMAIGAERIEVARCSP